MELSKIQTVPRTCARIGIRTVKVGEASSLLVAKDDLESKL